MLNLLLALATLAPAAPAPAAQLAPTSQESELDRLLEGLSPEEQLARRVTDEVLVAQRASPAVVYIETNVVRQRPSFWGMQNENVQGAGSGMVIRDEGFIVTNYHVVRDARTITVSFQEKIDPRQYRADVVSFVQEEDLALLKIRGEEGQRFPTVPLGTSADLMIGEKVIAIGNPLGHTHTVSVGIISGLHRDVNVSDGVNGALHFDDLIQTDASINQGNSGGPLLNINGEMIGVNSAVNVRAENIGFAIPVDRVRQVLEDQLLGSQMHRAWLGYEVGENDDLVVTAVTAGGPAEQVGLRVGDRIVAIGDTPLESFEQYRFERVGLEPAEAVRMRVQRDGRERNLTIPSWDRVTGMLFERLGLDAREVAIRSRNGVGYALQVTQVYPGSPSEAVGLQAGDWLLAVRPEGATGRRVPTRVDLAGAISGLRAQTPLEIEIQRERRTFRGKLILGGAH
ncbi:MAG: trypsin-like peptidase domain-containing protein [Planctomycetes bacterium]|nr:trypsin-like peptidase domain-containing protein [Planctomycetota bacterium]